MLIRFEMKVSKITDKTTTTTENKQTNKKMTYGQQRNNEEAQSLLENVSGFFHC